MKFICLYSHPMLPLCKIQQASSPADQKEWTCIKAYRYDEDATKVLAHFGSLHEKDMKAENIFNVKPDAFVESFDQMLARNAPRPRPLAVRAIALILVLTLGTLHIMFRIVLLPFSIILMLIMGGGLAGTALIAVLYRYSNLVPLVQTFMGYTTKK